MQLKKMIPLSWKSYMTYLLSKRDKTKYGLKQRKKVIVALAADYGNLGDVAITLAQEEYLKSIFPDYEIIDFPISETYTGMKSLQSIVNQDDIITIVGGGNMGDWYDDIEACRQFVVKKFPNNKIVSFPQTIEFDNEKKLRKCIRTYSKHRNFTLAAREKSSYELMKKYFSKNSVVLTPDIVLTMNYDKCLPRENDVTTLIRSDKEGILSDEERSLLISQLQQRFSVRECDTVIEIDRMDVQERKRQLEEMLSTIARSSVVITNRLHGMIFCAITRTPCVILPIKGNKLQGVYEWLKELGYIKLCESCELEEVEKVYKEVLSIKPKQLNISTEFEPLKKILCFKREA